MRLAIIGEAWGEAEAEFQRPFCGPSGRVLNGVLRHAGIIREDCLVTNVFNLRPPGNNIDALCGPKHMGVEGWNYIRTGQYVRAEFQPELDRLFTELEEFNPHCILALGNTPLWALCKKTGIKKYRGTPLLSYCERWKVVPSWHPSAVMRQWNLRPILIADTLKAKDEATFPELRRPRREVWIEPTLADIEFFYEEHIVPAEALSVDIETAHGTITEIGFAPSHDLALVIPFYSRAEPSGNYWPSHSDEVATWRWVKRILQEKPCFGQNVLYDVDYLWRTVGITVPKLCDDTMLLHHALQPEMEKGLGFLGSVYTREPSWKFMRQDNETLKKED